MSTQTWGPHWNSPPLSILSVSGSPKLHSFLSPMSYGRKPATLCFSFTCHTDGPGHTLAAAAAAKSLQPCPTLCDPMDSSPPASPVPGILQARLFLCSCKYVCVCLCTCTCIRNKVTNTLFCNLFSFNQILQTAFRVIIYLFF